VSSPTVLCVGEALLGRAGTVRISAMRDTAGWLTGVSHTVVPGIVPSLLVAFMRWRVPWVAPSVVMLLLLLLLLMLLLMLLMLLCRVRFMMGRSRTCCGGAGRSVGRVDLRAGVPGVAARVDAGRAVDLPGGRATS